MIGPGVDSALSGFDLQFAISAIAQRQWSNSPIGIAFIGTMLKGVAAQIDPAIAPEVWIEVSFDGGLTWLTVSNARLQFQPGLENTFIDRYIENTSKGNSDRPVNDEIHVRLNAFNSFGQTDPFILDDFELSTTILVV